MSKLVAVDLELTTDASGDAVGTVDSLNGRKLNGYIVALLYVKDDFAAGVDFDVVTSVNGLTVLDEDDVNASATYYPRAQVHTTSGVAAVLNSDDDPVLDRIPLAHEGITWTVANGGDTKSGTLTLIVERTD